MEHGIRTRRRPSRRPQECGGLEHDGAQAALQLIGPYVAGCKPENLSAIIDVLSSSLGEDAARRFCLGYPRVLAMRPSTLAERLGTLERLLDDAVAGDERRRREVLAANAEQLKMLRDCFSEGGARRWVSKYAL